MRCQTRLDEHVAIVGNHPVLGEWDTLKAISMHTSSANYPIWTINIDLPRGTKVEYKFVKKSTCNDGAERFTWEVLQVGNRVVETLNRARVILFEQFSGSNMRREDILPASIAVSPN